LSAHAQPDADTIRTLEEAHASKSSSGAGAGERSGVPSHPQKSWRLHQEQALWLEVKTAAPSLHTHTSNRAPENPTLMPSAVVRQAKDMKLERKRAELAREKLLQDEQVLIASSLVCVTSG
jgi:hypothetical protein